MNILFFVISAFSGAVASLLLFGKIIFLEAFWRMVWFGKVDLDDVDEAAKLLLTKPTPENKADSVPLTIEQLNRLRHGKSL